MCVTSIQSIRLPTSISVISFKSNAFTIVAYIILHKSSAKGLQLELMVSRP